MSQKLKNLGFGRRHSFLSQNLVQTKVKLLNRSVKPSALDEQEIVKTNS